MGHGMDIFERKLALDRYLDTVRLRNGEEIFRGASNAARLRCNFMSSALPLLRISRNEKEKQNTHCRPWFMMHRPI